MRGGGFFRKPSASGHANLLLLRSPPRSQTSVRLRLHVKCLDLELATPSHQIYASGQLQIPLKAQLRSSIYGYCGGFGLLLLCVEQSVKAFPAMAGPHADAKSFCPSETFNPSCRSGPAAPLGCGH